MIEKDEKAVRPTSAKRKGLSKKTRFEVLKRDSFKCQYCGASAPDVLLQVDHIKPVAGEGTDDFWNLVTSCTSCNSGKSDRPLSDSSVLAKSKRQLDELQERREQIEMLLEWRNGLQNLAEETLDHVCSMCANYMQHDFTPSPQNRHKLGQLLNQYGFDLLAEAISISASQYLRVDEEGDITMDSARTFLYKIGAICNVKSHSAQHPESNELYRLRGLLAYRLRKHDAMYYDATKALCRIRECLEIGISAESIRIAINSSKCWSQFMNRTRDLIEGL